MWWKTSWTSPFPRLWKGACWSPCSLGNIDLPLHHARQKIVLRVCEGLSGWDPGLVCGEQDGRTNLQADTMGARKFLERLAAGCAPGASTRCWPQGFPREYRIPDPQEARGGAQSPRRGIEVPAGSQGGSREGQPRRQRGVYRPGAASQTGDRLPGKWDHSSPPTSVPKGVGNPWKMDPKRIWLGCSAGSHPLARHRPISAPSRRFLHPTTKETVR